MLPIIAARLVLSMMEAPPPAVSKRQLKRDKGEFYALSALETVRCLCL